jgi:hypothetical protein
MSAGESRVELPGGVPSRCVRRSAILRGRTADAVVRTVDVPVAREGGATPPRGADGDRAPGGARPSDGVAPPSLICAHCLIGDGPT